jgi:6-phosphofructokinase 1
MKKIGLLTSGGDSPGMNTCIRAVVRTAVGKGISVVGIRRGYVGMINGDMYDMDARSVGGILQRGGTILGTARSDEFMTKKGQREAIRQLNESSIDGLVVIGGDGSLKGAQALHEQGIKVVGVPASIDNDIWGTNMSIGVDTALNTIQDAVDKLRDTASSHHRAFVVETMGRDCDYLALMGGVTSGAEIVVAPGKDIEISEIASEIEDAYIRGKNHCIIMVAEGAKLKVHEISQKLKEIDVGFHTRVTVLGHTQRGGRPSAFDRIIASRFGIKAVEALLEGESGIMVGLKGRDIEYVSLKEVAKRKRKTSAEFKQMARMLAI